MGRYIAVTVLFYEVPVPTVIHIAAFKTIALLILLYCRSIALTIIEMPLELRAVSIASNTFTMYLPVLELSLKNVTILARQFTTTIGQVLFPLALIDITVLPHQNALSGLITVKKLP